jgi:hypothetical protein
MLRYVLGIFLLAATGFAQDASRMDQVAQSVAASGAPAESMAASLASTAIVPPKATVASNMRSQSSNLVPLPAHVEIAPLLFARHNA